MDQMDILSGMKNLQKKTRKSLDTVSPGIGQHLRSARKKAGLSSEVAAGKLGMTHTTLNRYENNHREPGAADLARMASLYKVRIEALFFGEAAPAAVVPQEIPVCGKFLSRTCFDVDFNRKATEFLPIHTINPRFYAVKVVGNAMGVAYDGEYVILEKPAVEKFMDFTVRDGAMEALQGESAGKVVGIFRRPR